ncbi:MAG: terminase large subunit [Bifidobacterium tibiigranuli]|jgi:phage terminase large subunit-like protein|uniref:terminase large subunit n=1 Tax=Bifidobacterium tibiigranuli TaxID=2172043 RepID=UPI0026ECFB1D|nr:terminase TerL endonuclease subunit [Bifidobacterium tibiigranuli]MCI1673151.1 terminase large subunit [Bifidobacterium tibiigranuli]MCI1713604.1 terminase large subunit [Bifidobacterium tibiigranuli]
MAARKATRSRSTDRPYAAPLSPEVKWYLKSRGIELHAWQKPLWRTTDPRDAEGAYFDPERVDKVIDTLRHLRHTQGKWAGHPLRPDPWQIAYIIAPVFGWVRRNADGRVVRIIRSVWIEVPRKNGKTTIASGLGLYLAFADGEHGAQVIAAAGSKEQAWNAYRPAQLIAENSPDFKAAGIQSMKKEIVRPIDQSFFKAVGSIGDLLQGTNPSGYIVDEMHVHRDSTVIDALESGTGAREQPLGLIITTADDGKMHSPYSQHRDRVEKLCKGVFHNDSEYAVIFAAPKTADPFKETTWMRANPGYGVSPTKEFMRAEADKAKDSPLNLARFLRLNLNVRTKQTTKYISMRAWQANERDIDENALRGKPCYGGLDLASVSDLSALCWLFPDGDRFQAIWRFWTPEENLRALDLRTNVAASAWAADGWLSTTPGNVQDYDFIRAAINHDAEAFDIRSLGYDPYNSSQLVNDLVADGINMVKVRQGYLTLSPPLKQIQRLVLAGMKGQAGIAHQHPVMDWCMDNLAVTMDPAENVKPDKAKSGDKIDGVAALVNAMSEAMADAESSKRSAYEGHGLLIA